uniref:Prolyl endopeptidase n=1 Tax=Parastrongyloides trichosuri TaxID=131310 RepID=A0A0N4ZK30_PARTI
MPVSAFQMEPSVYPIIRRDENVADDYHGTKIKDPYRYLEDPDGEETKQFVTACNKITEPFLNGCTVRKEITKKLTDLWNYEKFTTYAKHGDFYYHYYNTGLQNQSVLYRQKTLNDKAEIFFDPNTLSTDGTTFVRQQKWSREGEYLALGISEKGSDWVTVKFLKAEDGSWMKDCIKGVKHSCLSWMPDNRGIFYSKYPEHKSEVEGTNTEKHSYHSLYYHKMGTSQEQDILVADFRSDPNIMVSGTFCQDDHRLIVETERGCDPTNVVYYYDVSQNNSEITGKIELKPLFTKNDAKYCVIHVKDTTAWVVTNYKSPMFKLIKVNLSTADQGSSTWETVIEEDSKRKLDSVCVVAQDKMFVEYLEDVKSALYVYKLESGEKICKLPFGIGSISSIGCRAKRTEFFIGFESFIAPMAIYHGDFKDMINNEVSMKIIREVKINGYDKDKFETQQVFYNSKDGTKIPMFLLYKKGVKLDGNNPTMLYGYGGFNISVTPCFSISNILFVSNLGGVYAMANIRGGSEYGETWHEGGMKLCKQNCFDDFIAAGEYLVNNKYTSPDKLIIHGGSNGGLLVAACSQQRPDLFGVVINRVGVLDMLRYQKFTIGGAWIPEFGCSDVKEEFDYIYKYSPLHNLKIPKNKIQWPSTLLMTADHDDRVVPSHSLKYIAELYHVLLEAKEYQKNPVLIRVEVAAGHGAGKPTSKRIDELVDLYCFIQRVLDIQWKE